MNCPHSGLKVANPVTVIKKIINVCNVKKILKYKKNLETKFLSVVFSDSNNKLFFATKKNNDSRYRVSEIMIFDNDDETCCLPLLIDNYRLIYLKTDNTVMEYNFVENEK